MKPDLKKKKMYTVFCEKSIFKDFWCLRLEEC